MEKAQKFSDNEDCLQFLKEAVMGSADSAAMKGADSAVVDPVYDMYCALLEERPSSLGLKVCVCVSFSQQRTNEQTNKHTAITTYLFCRASFLMFSIS